MSERPPATRDLITIGQAASLLGVSISTLRNWDRGQKLSAHRHPINGYRLYRRAEVLALVRRIESSKPPAKGGRR